VSAEAWDPIAGQPVLMAPGRAARPHDTGSTSAAPARPCPFCEGAERDTPRETYAERADDASADSPGWTVRVVPNKFPVMAPGEGVHEVVVPTPRHVTTLGELTVTELADAMRVLALRMEVAGDDGRDLVPFAFVNQGAAAGASLQHIHAQVVGLPLVPPIMRARDAAFTSDRNPIADELSRRPEFRVGEHRDLVAWCPPVPPLSGTIRIAPTTRAAQLDSATDYTALGALLAEVVGRVDRAFDAPALNVMLHQQRPGGSDHFHWHVDVVPRLGTLAGLELGTGVMAIAQEPRAMAERLSAA